MLLSSQNLIGLQVQTRSGENLGHISAFDIDADTLSIIRVYVRPRGLVRSLTQGDLIIRKNQIIYLDNQKMVVEDSFGKELVKKQPIEESAPVAS